MGKHAKTLALIAAAHEILEEQHPMTVRQVYYQLVSRQAIKNRQSEYDRVQRALVGARRDGVIAWDWIEDRLRRPCEVSMWDDLSDFAETARRVYRRTIWATQPCYLEVWLEKDALSGIFEDVLQPYGVTLNVGRGFDSASALYHTAKRYGSGTGITLLCFSDFDPSGEGMIKSLREWLTFFKSRNRQVCADAGRHTALQPPDCPHQKDRHAAGGVCGEAWRRIG